MNAGDGYKSNAEVWPQPREEINVYRMYSLLFLSLAIACYCETLHAQCIACGNAVCAKEGDQIGPRLVSDGAGGAIIVWDDGSSGNGDIFASRIDSLCHKPWGETSIGICTSGQQQRYPRIVTDGTGGAYVAFNNFGPFLDIYVQHISVEGVLYWDNCGKIVCEATAGQNPSVITADGSGGAIVAWGWDSRNGNGDIYAQKINRTDTILWTENGVPVCTTSSIQTMPCIISDGAGGAIIAWEDWTDGESNVSAQRVGANGQIRWDGDGVSICVAAGDQLTPVMVADGCGGAIIAWADRRVPGNSDIYAQRVDSTGMCLWEENGDSICTVSGWHIHPQVASDDDGGAIITWQDSRVTGETDIYAQKIDGYGAVQWGINGVPVCIAEGYQHVPLVVSDGLGGAVIAWGDARYDTSDVYAQRISAEGCVYCPNNGLAICEMNGQQGVQSLAKTGQGKIVMAWQDTRSGNWDIYLDYYSEQSEPPMAPQNVAGCATYFEHQLIFLSITWDQNPEPVLGYRIMSLLSGDYYHALEDSCVLDTFVVTNSFFDIDWNWMPHRYYKIFTVDSSLCESCYSLLTYDDICECDAVCSGSAPSVKQAVLYQNYPNPFNPITEILFETTIDGDVRLLVFDTAGELVKTLVDDYMCSGKYGIRWRGLNNDGNPVATGVYYYMLTSGKSRITKKMILLR